MFAFIIHTLLPGPCKVLYQQLFGQDVNVEDEGITYTDVKEIRREQCLEVALQVSYIGTRPLICLFVFICLSLCVS